MISQIDSIVALSTPPGRSGIGVVRLSGPQSLAILESLTGDQRFEPNKLTLRKLVDPLSSEMLDEALVCFFKRPHSFTGEDVVEFHCHGSPVILRQIIDATLRLGARIADAGEFSLRAVRNGRLDLTQAEAIRDLINAQTEAAASQATRQMYGEISHRLQPAKDQLVRVIVRLESSLEFVEDDLPQIEQGELLESLRNVERELLKLTQTFGAGRLLHDGLTVAFVGRPNVGKSSLFNGLLGHDRAIVTDVPGTTRDTISEPIAMNGVPVSLIDTAGVRTVTDLVEAMGVERTRRAAADADLLIAVIDGSEHLTKDDFDLLNEIAQSTHIVAVNKSDLLTFSVRQLPARLSSHSSCVSVIPVSAHTEAGLAELRAAILKPFVNGNEIDRGLLITNARHHDLLMCATSAIESSERLLLDRASEELVLVGLHNALRYLGEVTGETTTEQILGEIFSTFCIGK